MSLADSIDPKKWYRVVEVSEITGWGVDAVRRWIYRKQLRAFIHPCTGKRRPRIYRCCRVLGADLITFIRVNLNYD